MNIAEQEAPKLLTTTIADFLKDDGRGSELLKIMGLPIRGNEDKSLIEVCTSQKRNENEVLKEIERFKKGAQFEYPEGIFSWSPKLVVRYLEEEHHVYTKSLIQDAKDYGNRAWDVHGTQYPELNQIKWYVEKLSQKLDFHLRFKEEKFFPKAIKLFNNDGMVKDGTVQSLAKGIKLIQKDREEIEYFMQRIRDLSNQFTPPKEACTTFQLLYSTLKKLNEDMEKHHFLEEQYIVSKLKSELKALMG